ncbi:uncharacterized protein METZ01_LOCUS27530 [marine metagenome]|uniref:Uncharacterized protein n=1 Tax=marine metagenome TaxID=408172 RepID=A0A381Q5P4_9ZZZZ|tara:strand:+ start:6270 stop:7355 length:1086 start_codon:yes stop_codon:yes gene_type:complete
MKPIQVKIKSGSHTYPVHIGSGLIANLETLLRETILSHRPFIISNQLVWKLHGQTIGRAIPGADTILIPDGERYKRQQTVDYIYDALIRAGADRHTVLIAVGGGVVGDIAGYAAATFLRGLSLVHVPTTLLAQVDSSIGGKVGINHKLGKNLIGAFHPPRLVAIDPQLLDTLPRREFRAGLYEVIKYGMIASPTLFKKLGRELTAVFNHEPRALMSIITKCCRIKASIVQSDERETGLRRVLNFGHTVGHAIESATRYRRFRHGEAVAFGMLAAASIAETRGEFSTTDCNELGALIRRLGPLPSSNDLSIKQIINTVKQDKKIIQGKLHFVLPTGIGLTTIVEDVTSKQIERALKKLGMRN